MNNNLENLLKEAKNLFDCIDNTTELEQAKARYLGKNGVLTEMLRGLESFPPKNDLSWVATSTS